MLSKILRHTFNLFAIPSFEKPTHLSLIWDNLTKKFLFYPKLNYYFFATSNMYSLTLRICLPPPKVWLQRKLITKFLVSPLSVLHHLQLLFTPKTLSLNTFPFDLLYGVWSTFKNSFISLFPYSHAGTVFHQLFWLLLPPLLIRQLSKSSCALVLSSCLPNEAKGDS